MMLKVLGIIAAGFIAIFILLLVLVTPGVLQATPIVEPTIIKEPGHYRLRANISIDEPGRDAIVITASNVTLDMSDYAIIGPKSGTANAIYVSGSNVTIVGGLVSGFMYGVRAEADDVTVRGVDASRNHFRGISVKGARAFIEGNVIEETRGYPDFPDSFAMAIELNGQNGTVRSNRIKNVHPFRVGEGIGISLSADNAGCVVADNIIVQNVAPDYGRVFGIWYGELDKSITIRNNTVTGGTYGIKAWSGNLLGNVVDTECSLYHGPPDYHRLNLETASGCLDTLEAMTLKVEAEPEHGEWRYRLAAVYRERLDDLATADLHVLAACDLRIDEACRVAAKRATAR